MPIQIVVGSQWGDEGKGKTIDILAEKANLVVRAQGGNNAGHTIKLNNQTYTLKLVPSGILYENVKCLIGCGTVINPKALLDEIKTLTQLNISLKNLAIDPRAHTITPWHIELDQALENERGDLKIGTTKNGIGPCYADKAYRLGVHLYDLTDSATLTAKLNMIGSLKNKILKNVFNKEPIDISKVIEEYLAYGQLLKPYFNDGVKMLNDAITNDESVLFEGAQGTMLDINFGTYPFVTSSSAIAGGMCTGAAIGPTKINSTIGVAKAYLTRVGEGPMPTEIDDETSNLIRNVGNEFGTNTKRARRIGWLDCAMLKYAVQVNGIDKIALNKLDVLKGIDPLNVCYAYKNSAGEIVENFPPSLNDLNKLTPIYKQLPGFFDSIENCTTFEQLPQACKDYVKTVEDLCGCKIAMIGVGPKRFQNIEI